MNIDKDLDTLFEKEEKNDKRMDKIMALIEEEPMKLQTKKSKNTFKKIASMAAALMICFSLFVPIGGQSFAGGVIDWFQNTIIETDSGFVEASDGQVNGPVDDYETVNYKDEKSLINEMDRYSFVMPVLPDNFVFDSAFIHTFDQEPLITTLYWLKYVNESNTDQELYVQVSMSEQEKLDEDPSKVYGHKVVAEGLKSSSIPFLEEEALFLNYNGNYSIISPHVYIELGENMVYDLFCQVSYSNIEGPELWQEAQKLLEDIYLQYK